MVEPSKKWLMEVKRSSEAIWILSPSMDMPCSLRGTDVEALYNPTVGNSIMSEFLAKNLLGDMPLVPTNKLFKSSLGLIFECNGIVRAMPIEINETKVHLDFHIYAILDFDLLIGCPSEVLFQEKSSHGSLNEEFGKTASATHLDIPMAKQRLPNHDPFKKVKFISPFILPKLSCEMERPSPPSLEPEPCPSGYPNTILENKNFGAMDVLEAPTLETEENDSTVEHESFYF
jgi:hypothetical protein